MWASRRKYHKLENRQLRLPSLRNKKINQIGIIDSVLWDPTWHTNIYISVVSEEEREKGRNNIWKNNGPNLPKFDENISLYVKEVQ